LVDIEPIRQTSSLGKDFSVSTIGYVFPSLVGAIIPRFTGSFESALNPV
jgi:hypothetical protein